MVKKLLKISTVKMQLRKFCQVFFYVNTSAKPLKSQLDINAN